MTLNINNYPPLYFVITSLLETRPENIIFQGRILSIFSGFIIAINGFILSIHYGAKAKAAFIGGLWLIATLASFYLDFFGANDPHMFAVSVSITAFTLIQTTEKKSIILIGTIFMVASVFIKQNTIGIPLATLIILYIYDKKKFYLVIPFGIFLGLIGIAICYHHFGDKFIHQMLFKRDMWLLRPFSRIGRLQWVIPALALILIKYKSFKVSPYYRQIIILIFCTLFSNFLSQFGEGVSNNSQFELLVATQIALSFLLSQNNGSVSKRSIKINYNNLIVSVLLLRLVLGAILDPYLLAFSSQYRKDIYDRSENMKEEILKISQLPGNVSCSVRTVCFLGTKGFVYDDWAMRQRLKTKTFTKEELDQLVRNQSISFVKNSELFIWDNDVRIDIRNLLKNFLL
jgi:hypothetical protein